MFFLPVLSPNRKAQATFYAIVIIANRSTNVNETMYMSCGRWKLKRVKFYYNLKPIRLKLEPSHIMEQISNRYTDYRSRDGEF